MLLAARSSDPTKTAILNIKPPLKSSVESICEDLDLNLTFAPEGKLQSHQGIDIIFDEGGFGWEPSLYILAHNPLELVDRMHQICAVM
jgi:hypothetical protein